MPIMQCAKFRNVCYVVCHVLQCLLCSVPCSTMSIMQYSKFYNVHYAVCQIPQCLLCSVSCSKMSNMRFPMKQEIKKKFSGCVVRLPYDEGTHKHTYSTELSTAVGDCEICVPNDTNDKEMYSTAAHRA